MNDKKHDFIVIGGGICGLQIGALCARLGSVLLLEKEPFIGGRARVVEKNGFKLDWGPHPVRFGMNSPIARTMKDIGVNDIKWLKPKFSHAWLSDGKKTIFPSGLMGILKSKMLPKLKFFKMILDLRKRLKSDPMMLKSKSIHEYCSENGLDSRLVTFLKISSAAMQVNPDMHASSIGELAENMLEVMRKGSIAYPANGWNDFILPLKEKIEQHGKILLSTRVNSILTSDQEVVGVETMDGVIYKGRHVISTIPVQELFNILDPGLASAGFVEKCRNLRPTSGISVDFCLSKSVTKDQLVFFEDPPSFGFFPGNMGAKVTPEGKSIMYFFMPLTRKMIGTSKTIKKNYLDAFKNRIFGTYPEIENHVEFKREMFLDMVDGVEIAVDQHGENRPGPEGISVKNLYLTGDSIGGSGAGGEVGHSSVRECYSSIKSIFKK
ncbi:MAG: phytoene desaturase family protein [Promethearchaeota archaeon]